jgi:hypothetical protein
MYLPRANTVFGIHEQPHDRKPLLKAQGRILKNGAGLQREFALRMQLVASPHAGIRQIGNRVRTALRAEHLTVRPARLHHIGLAVLKIVVENHGFLKSFWGARKPSMRLLVVSVKYIYAKNFNGGHFAQRSRLWSLLSPML